MGTIADKLTYLGQTKAEIREAIISKGVTLPVETTFREYAGKILEITSDGGAENPVDWKRPADWLPIEKMVAEGDQKFVGLHAIFEDSNFISLTATGDYTVDWGDGVVEHFGSGIRAYHQYSYDAFKGTECERGYRQAIVIVTPRNGQALTAIYLQSRHSQTGLNSYSSGWLDIRMSGGKMTNLTIGGMTTTHNYLEAFCFLGNNLITDFYRLFHTCYALRSVPLLDTSKGTNFKEMFMLCTMLKKIPVLDTANGIDFSSMFTSCFSLQKVPLFNTSKGTDFSSMFMQCYALQSVPLLDTSRGLSFGNMFSSCYTLQSVPLFDTSNGTSFSVMFSSCIALKTVPLFDTSKGIYFSYMFYGSCLSLQKVPLFDTSNGTDFSYMFGSCTALETVPLFNTSNGTSFSAMFSGCYSLIKGALSGTKSSIPYYDCKLSQSALVDIFNNLGEVESQTIIISNNWGTSLLTEDERAIATKKGWTIIG